LINAAAQVQTLAGLELTKGVEPADPLSPAKEAITKVQASISTSSFQATAMISILYNVCHSSSTAMPLSRSIN